MNKHSLSAEARRKTILSIVLGYIWSMIFDGILSRYGTSILL